MDNTSGFYFLFFIETFLRMVFLRILPSPVIKEMISANMTIGANEHILHFLIEGLFMSERLLYMEKHIHDYLYFNA